MFKDDAWVPRCLYLLCFLCAGLLQTACITKYPASERQSMMTYPLPECTGEMLTLMKTQVDAPVMVRARSNTICVTRPLDVSKPTSETAAQENSRMAAQAAAPYEKDVREALEPPFMKGAGAKSFGIALSGGGTKSSSFSMGVLAGLADHGMLDSADYISTVSGGGYAAYFYYAHHLFPLVRGGQRRPVTSVELFADCVDKPEFLAVSDVNKRYASVNFCHRAGMNSQALTPELRQQEIRYQSFLRCTQDILRPGECDTRSTDGFDWGVSKVSLLGSVALFPFSNITNTLFDWGYSTSPAGRTYHDGIGLSNGSTFADPANPALADTRIVTPSCRFGSGPRRDVLDCTSNVVDPDPLALTFDELRTGLLQLNRHNRRLPFWIINATATKYRSVFGWLARSPTDTTNSDLFEMTPVSHGSGRYGHVSAAVSIYDMTVLDAVAASAAFLDSNQQVYQNRLGKTAAGIGLHVFNLDWGYDIPNYNVSTTRRQIHRALPVPFYYLDGLFAGAGANANRASSVELDDRRRSVYIRLIDGGNSENLGVYALIKRNTRTILMADAAQDRKGLFGDVCGLKRRLQQAPENSGFPRYLYVPGLGNFDQHCAAGTHSEGYDLHRWSAADPILLACVRTTQASGPPGDACRHLGPGDTRLFIMKPALDWPAFVGEQVTVANGQPQVKRCYLRGADKADETSLLNCDTAAFLIASRDAKRGSCPLFPQHGTAIMTANSSATLFVAYRELARQYVAQKAAFIKQVIADGDMAVEQFGQRAAEQARGGYVPQQSPCAALTAMGAGMAGAAPLKP